MQFRDLSRQECSPARFFRTEQHILRKSAATATLGPKKLPIHALYTVARRKPEGARGPVDRSGSSFELEERTNGGLVDLDVEAGEPKSRPVSFIAEAWPESQQVEPLAPSSRASNDQFSFELLLVARPRSQNGSFRRDNRLPRASGNVPGGSWPPGSQTEEEPSAAEVLCGRVVERIPLENPALTDRLHLAQFADETGQICDRKLDLDFPNRAPVSHGQSITRLTPPTLRSANEPCCQRTVRDT